MIKCCVFDLDGTILNTITSITYFVNQTLKKYGFECITEDECKYFAGNGARKLIIRSLASKGVTDEATVERVLSDYNAAYDENPLYLTTAFDGIRELLLALAERNIRLAVL
jgi:phosphoglycolate phosphatase